MNWFKRLRRAQIRQTAQAKEKADDLRLVPEPSPPPTLPHTETERQALVEQRIQDAIANGLFDNLPGRGKPLPLLTNPYLDSGQELAFGLLKNNGLAPEWIERDKEIRQTLARFRTNLAAAAHLPDTVLAAQFEARLKSLNRKIDDFNLIVPISGKQRPRLNLADEIRRTRRPSAAGPLLG